MPSSRTEPIFTPRTPRVVAARRLAQSRHRAATGRFLVEGPQVVRAALERARLVGTAGAVAEVFVTDAGRSRHPELIEQARTLGARISLVSEPALAGLADTVAPQGIVAVCATTDTTLERVAAACPRLVAVLVEIRDPGNAGTIARTADAAGADAVVFAGQSVDPYNGKCVRASAGSLFNVELVRASVEDTLARLAEAGLTLLAADSHGERTVDELDHGGELARPVAWLFGSEAHGLPAGVRERADVRVRIPLYGRAESLNLAVAAGLCLYASARGQRGG